MSVPFFITSPGTDVGKTLVTTTLCWQLRERRHHVTALKPVITGFNASDANSDTSLILKSCGLSPTPELIKAISPWQFVAPLAPSTAAQKEKTFIVFEEVIAFCEEHAAVESDILLVEGAGGLMSPLDDRHTMLDWLERLRWPAIVVSGSYLGAISHTLTTLEVLKARSIPVAALVISETANSEVSLADTALGMESFVSNTIPIVKLPRVRAESEKWKHIPNISWICAETKERENHV